MGYVATPHSRRRRVHRLASLRPQCIVSCVQIVKEQGIPGLFKGIVPRVGLGIWQTLCMVTGAKLVKDALAER